MGVFLLKFEGKRNKKVNILVINTHNMIQEVYRMFEYGKDIPLEGALVDQAAQQEKAVEQQNSEGTIFSFDHRKDIPLDGVK